jgi:hypothetical protein
MGNERKGVFAEIDTESSREAMETLRSGSEEDRVQIAEQIAANSADYCPAVFFDLAGYHHNAGRTSIGLFWLFAGRIRTWFDIQRCTDRSVEAAADALGNSTPELLRLSQFENLEESRKILERAVQWDGDTDHNYDECWIALHGLGPSLPDAESKTRESLTIPKDEWDALAEKNRTEYQAAYIKQTSAMDESQLQEIKAKAAQLRGQAL